MNLKTSSDVSAVGFEWNHDWSVHVTRDWDVQVEIGRHRTIVEPRTTQSNVVYRDEVILAAENLCPSLTRAGDKIPFIVSVDQLKHVSLIILRIGEGDVAVSLGPFDAN